MTAEKIKMFCFSYFIKIFHTNIFYFYAEIIIFANVITIFLHSLVFYRNYSVCIGRCKFNNLKMDNFTKLLTHRHSSRNFSDKELSADNVSTILEAALLSPTSKNCRKWMFHVVDDKETLEKLADSKENGAAFLKEAAMAVAVVCDDKDDDCWIEDCSIAAVTMQYQAASLGIGSCWCQIRERYLSDGTKSEDVVRGILDIADNFRVLCIIGFGYAADSQARREQEPLWERVVVD